MRRLSLSIKIYIALILALALSNATQVFLPSYLSLFPTAELPAPVTVLALAHAGIAIVIYGGLGFVGLTLAKKVGFPEIWDEKVTNRQRLLAPGLTGVLGGIFLIVADLIFSRFNSFGRFVHPAFPSSFFTSLSAGIGEEILFRLFFIPLWMWIISNVMLKGQYRNRAFWISNIASALAFAFGHFPGLMLIFGYESFLDIPPVLVFEVILLNGVISVLAACYMRKWGFLAAAGIHFWTDIVWHVIWGLF